MECHFILIPKKGVYFFALKSLMWRKQILNNDFIWYRVANPELNVPQDFKTVGLSFCRKINFLHALTRTTFKFFFVQKKITET